MTDNGLDRITISGIEIDCVVGINDWERLAKQRITIDITLHASVQKAGETDQIGDTVNYRTITHRVVEEISGTSFGLIESLAERGAGLCLEDEKVRTVEVRVNKPGAVRHADSVGVEITRGR